MMEPIKNAPTKPGFYWALWMTAAKNTHEGEHIVPAPDWEVVEVVQNHLNEPDDESLCVMVTGVRETQWLENFTWGPGIQRPDLARYR